MPRFRVRMINSEFESSEEGDYQSLEAASKMAIASATRVASESIVSGETTTAVEIQIYDGEDLLSHHVVNVSVSELLPRA